ncbi:carbamoyltransferase HypF [Maribacter sp. MMG018]|uniref:carbamoyltransferase HypF n=1 Tax=Maribacter sp. MMG018 TaxID=2822688 RepID=UPI001B3888AB|nr:carbamoyltransferase HypF [Maribacter sp. MMG018]MBQ4914647.1 carbamoyltransferase HypF [Maribacter sp. MMG018]
MAKTFQIIISGQVQGVGFRPFVYGLAYQYRLKGMVCNNGDGVLVHVNSEEEKATEFLNAIIKKAPKISVIQSHSISEISFRSYDDFKILPSQAQKQINIPLTPDFVICESCKSEIRNTADRRYGYAFTTCTQCGPRYAVTTKFPFERINTSLSDFHMCTQCKTEYTDPNDRRFHSQTNSCRECGIQLNLTTSDGTSIATDTLEIIKKISGFILSGNIVALKNTNGYLLCCNANDKTAIARLREKKQRPTKPFALLYPSLEKIKKDFKLGAEEEKALTASAGPIVILDPKKGIADLERESIAPKLHQLGVMLPSSALLTLLMDALKIPIIATSGNIHGSPIISEAADAVKKLAEVADYFVHHNLNITFPQDDSVVRFAGEQRITLRRSRGLAPNYLNAPFSENKKVLAMGAHLKSTFAFVPNTHTYVSPYFGNLDSYDVSQRYQKSIAQHMALFDTRPELVLIDAHPQYQSSILGREWANEWKAELRTVQHHKAHFASVLGEHELFASKERIMGAIWDGTGLGDDGAIWGGEFFMYKDHKMERLAHFEYVDWIAADKMAKEPRLSLLCMLPKTERETVRQKFSDTEWKIYNKMLEKNTLKTSSVGRLFDAVASLLDMGDTTSYEGEAAMLLENTARDGNGDTPIDFLAGIPYQNIPTKSLMANILKAKKDDIPTSRIAHSFIHTLALSIVKTAKENHCETIACSGGVFQNSVLVEKLLKLSKTQGFKLKFNRILSSNDENISFGQLCYHHYLKN